MRFDNRVTRMLGAEIPIVQAPMGWIPVEPLITAKVGVEGVANGFEELSDPERHAKILVEPWRS